MKKVVLIGYMGSGKSVLSQKLSRKIEITSVELDEMIEKKCNLSIEKIFATKGELFFRKLEHQLFVELLENDEALIISTGGGTPCYFNNHELLQKEDVVSIYLKASIDTLFNRLADEKHKRPLIAHLNEEETKEFIAKHLFDRSFYYNQANFKVSVDGKSIETIVDEMYQLLT
ncbi:shikimate kinase [Flavobacterium sp.]|uniref:shikimate kinase n=1 Tax=Flavobacterium sp. TaxID=239 RepID=UPI000EE8BD1F|nr:shikimate kinase [Flavobacterium sp.]HCQ13291.1 shikimate kinase [Flavobacterium sp.]